MATWRQIMRVTAAGNALSDAVIARSGGEIVLKIIYSANGEKIHSEELCRVPMQHFKISANSIEIWGSSIGTGEAKAAKINKYSARKAGSSGISFDAPTIDPYLRPGDELSVGSDIVTASQIDYIIQPGEQMKLTAGVGGI